MSAAASRVPSLGRIRTQVFRPFDPPVSSTDALTSGHPRADASPCLRACAEERAGQGRAARARSAVHVQRGVPAVARGPGRAPGRPRYPVAALLHNSLDYAQPALRARPRRGNPGRDQYRVQGSLPRAPPHRLAGDGARYRGAYVERLVPILDEVPELVTVIVCGASSALEGTRLRVLGFDEVLAASPSSPVRSAESDLQSYFYTSETKGKSKGVRVPFAHAYASREDDRRFSSDDRHPPERQSSAPGREPRASVRIPGLRRAPRHRGPRVPRGGGRPPPVRSPRPAAILSRRRRSRRGWVQA